MSAAVTARYYEDLALGDVFTTAARTITEADVTLFAGLSGDFNPLHTDAAFAAESAFGERIAHGLLGMAVASGLTARLGLFEGTALAFLGVREWSFKGPIRLGDTVHAELEIADKRRTSDPARGIVSRATRLVNQHGDVVQEGTFVLMVRCRDDAEEGGPDA